MKGGFKVWRIITLKWLGECEVKWEYNSAQDLRKIDPEPLPSSLTTFWRALRWFAIRSFKYLCHSDVLHTTKRAKNTITTQVAIQFVSLALTLKTLSQEWLRMTLQLTRSVQSLQFLLQCLLGPTVEVLLLILARTNSLLKFGGWLNASKGKFGTTSFIIGERCNRGWCLRRTSFMSGNPGWYSVTKGNLWEDTSRHLSYIEYESP